MSQLVHLQVAHQHGRSLRFLFVTVTGKYMDETTTII